MTTPAAPNPQNMMLLAVLGVGAYLLTRRATAASVQPVNAAARPAGYSGGNSNVLSTINSLLSIGKAATNAYDAQTAVDASVLASSMNDGMPINVPNTSVFNAVTGPQLPADLASWGG